MAGKDSAQSMGEQNFSILKINVTLFRQDEDQIPPIFFSSAAKCLEREFAVIQAKPE